MDTNCNIELKERVIDTRNRFKNFLSTSVTNLEELFDFLKKIPVFIAELMETIDIFYKSFKPSKQQYFATTVYLTNCCVACDLCRHIQTSFLEEQTLMFEIKRCICKQILLLLDNIDSIFDNNTTVGNFLVLMDTALENLSEINIKQGKDTALIKISAIHDIIEEILCLCMSIAQVAFDEDKKIITAGCRTVLTSWENLKNEINQENPNIAMCNLDIDLCTDTLCAVEAKVNTAVLRLCLNIFSEYKQPMKDLYDFLCVEYNNDENLSPVISNFDLHMDRIFQIGLFSVASSGIGQRVADIQNIIANLEFLEGELIPAFVGTTKDESLYKKQFAETLKKYWCTQIKLLRRAVHGIIEPSAYCKLVSEELQQKIEEIWDDTSKNKIHKSALQPFIAYIEELGRMISVNVDSFEEETKINVKKQLQIVYNVMKELIASMDLLLDENSSKTSHEKVYKRCQILVTTIKKLWLVTIEENTQTDQNVLVPEEKMPCSNTITENDTGDNSVLQNIIIKSKQLLKDRSICTFSQTITLDKTYKKVTVLQSNKAGLNPSRNNFTFSSSRCDRNSTLNKFDETKTIASHVLPHIEEKCATFK